MNAIFLTNIQRFSLHDGPGIRTTVFLKGCSINCPWCSNPENLKGITQKYIKNGIEGIYGEWYSGDDLFEEIVKDKLFFSGTFIDTPTLLRNPPKINELPGGITFSGGECLLQMSQLENVLKKLREEKIHISIETSLFASEEQVNIAIQYVDLFYIDVKILNKKKCREFLQGDLRCYFRNLEKVINAKKTIVIRIPVIGKYTDSDENRKDVVSLLKKYQSNIVKVELIKEHNLGVSKYQSLIEAGNNIIIPKYYGVTNELLEKYKEEIIKATNLYVEICAI